MSFKVIIISIFGNESICLCCLCVVKYMNEESVLPEGILLCLWLCTIDFIMKANFLWGNTISPLLFKL